MTGEGGSSLRFPDIPKLELDQLIDQLVDRAQEVKRAQGRLRALLRAIETITGDLGLEIVLRNVVESACELAAARYGALGVIGPDGGLEQFIHVGVSPEITGRIGHLPEGKGLLGALITDPRTIRLEHMSDDPRSVGFPAAHPPMDSFLGVPIHVRDEVYGNLYLADSARGAFSDEDEALVLALALAAGTAISNARLYQESRQQQSWLAASADIGAQLLTARDADPLHLIATRAMDVADADLVSLGELTADRTGLVVRAAVGLRADELDGMQFELAGTLAQEVVRSGAATLHGGASLTTTPAAVFEIGPLMVLPLTGSVAARGVLAVMRRLGRAAFSPVDLTMAAAFASHASVALELADSRSAEQKLMLLEDRDRIARDLHDHVIQELFATGLGLESIATRFAEDDPVVGPIRQRVDEIDRTIRRIRTSIFELRGPIAGGLRQRVLAVRSDLTDPLGFVPDVTFAGPLDSSLAADLVDDVVACVRETLTNVARHAAAGSAAVDVVSADRRLTVTVTDDGRGVTGATRLSGIGNLRRRAERRGGSFVLAPSPHGSGTVATWTVPV